MKSKEQPVRYRKWAKPQYDFSFAVFTAFLQRVKVSCRAGAKRVEAKGLFVGAEVVRGPHWRFGDQDGKNEEIDTG